MISVIVPTYNYAPYLKASLDSIFSQIDAVIQVIVIDNASTDETDAVLSHYRDRILYLKRAQNEGAGAARNEGVRLAEGTYLAFLDADDLWSPDKLFLQKEAINSVSSPDMVFSHVQNFYSPELDETMRSRLRFPKNAIQGIVPSTFFIRKDRFLEVGFFDPTLKAGEFIEWYARAKNLGLTTEILPDVLALRRVHEGHLGKRAHHQDYCRILSAQIKQRKMELA